MTSMVQTPMDYREGTLCATTPKRNLPDEQGIDDRVQRPTVRPASAAEIEKISSKTAVDCEIEFAAPRSAAVVGGDEMGRLAEKSRQIERPAGDGREASGAGALIKVSCAAVAAAFVATGSIPATLIVAGVGGNGVGGPALVGWPIA
jgi:hypothetical protein